ncbi:type 2 lantibiotic biosynthesis protein LanM [Butyrivibrio sp. ob235]|uniref:type 2 lanthipeptide synthetase LanM family protein n=1 Tax=Butyrivibrio sp. ob235 TaxID=1761780 RepID=UPI0008AFB725|nr:type 2 lanthipeptide synthetase LanM family protein [Butyrivibrio sp. ob235]SEL83250.1 type 2 lantibiotic biosynthesis protein LanM [Butyrivibrio sp. ob235]
MLVYDNVSERDVWEYWRTLFPEVKKDEELKDIISDSGKLQEGDIVKIWRAQATDNHEFFDWLKRQDDCFRHSGKWRNFISSNHMNNAFYPLFLFNKSKLDCLKDSIEKSGLYADVDRIYETIAEDICLRLREISIRTLISEIHVEKNLCNLEGDNGNKRYLFYMDHIWASRDYVQKFYTEYKELLEMQLVIFDNAYNSIREMIERIGENYHDLVDLIDAGGKNPLITDVQTGLGDSHRLGRTVSMLKFSNGKKVIYKPRSLRAETGFADYSKAVSEGLGLGDRSLYEIKAISREDYGFIEYITQDECQSKEELERYYYRCGIIMAMLYSLNAKDIHHENMISHGEYPVMIDLEALFHSRLEHRDINNEKTAYEVAMESIEDSVYSIGLLPMKLSNPYDKENGTVDISGFGATSQQVSPFKVLMIKNRDTDEICFEKSTYIIQPQKNVAKYKGAAVNASDYKDLIMHGFEDAYIYIMKDKSELISGFKRWFGETNTRIIYRPTYIYGKLMFTSNHPDFMREKAHRYILLHRMGYRVKPQERRIVSAEIRDILRGDVPFFEVNINSGEMRDSENKVLPLDFKITPFDKTVQKVNGFCTEDLEKQKLIIDNAFLSKAMEDYRELCVTGTDWSDTPMKMEREAYLKIAENIALQILNNAHEAEVLGKKQLSWVNFTPIGDDQINYEYTPVGGDLYSGTSGIGLFLLYLWKETKKKDYLEAAYACMDAVITQMKKIDDDSYYLIGPFNGLSGYIYVMSKFWLLTGDTSMRELVYDGLSRMKKIYFRDTNYDVISGAAGAIKVCFSLVNNFDGKIKALAEELIVLLTHHLLDNKLKLEDGSIAWRSGINGAIYTGYAHGSSGIEEVLYSVNEKYHIDGISEVLEESGAFLNKMYVRKDHNWKTMIGKDNCSQAWCHGAPGVLYGRMKRYKSMSRFERADFLNNLKVMKNKAIGNNICYCHGDIGNIELIRRIAEVVGDEELKNECGCTYSRLASGFLHYIKERPLLPYGLMLGLSGIGYSLLATISDDVPFILDLE